LLFVAGLLLLALTVCGIAAAPAIRTIMEKMAELNDEDAAKLGAALSARWGPDDSIPTAYYGFNIVGSLDEEAEAQVWLEIEISYTGTCDSTPTDPCERLVDELARIVFDNYPPVDDLAGIRVTITNRSEYGNLEITNTPIDKALTIAQWRRELSIQN
jgi:hypothetical protein